MTFTTSKCFLRPSQEALTLRDLRLGLQARRGVAEGLMALPRRRLRRISEAQELLRDADGKAPRRLSAIFQWIFTVFLAVFLRFVPFST